jgi:hypothetical protein
MYSVYVVANISVLQNCQKCFPDVPRLESIGAPFSAKATPEPPLLARFTGGRSVGELFLSKLKGRVYNRIRFPLTTFCIACIQLAVKIEFVVA